MSAATFQHDGLIFDWNRVGAEGPWARKQVELVDETLRDGIQSPSVVDPEIEHKLELVQLMDDLGIAYVDIGLPGAGSRAQGHVTALARYIQKNKLRIQPTCAARTLAQDIAPVAEVVQKVGMPITVYTFIGSSPIRQMAEAWDLPALMRISAEAIDFAVKSGLKVVYVTEDTTRSSPASLEPLFKNAVDHGVSGLCLCDTVGHATPEGVRQLVRWTQSYLRSVGAQATTLDWHGHNDRGLAVINSLTAAEAGVDRVHGCALGIGERVGNAAMDQLLVNLRLLGAVSWDLSKLVRYVKLASEACQFPIGKNYPLAGEDAFRTATGVHAAAIVKAKRMGDEWLADRVYSGVPAHDFGKEQEIEIGPMSGMSNVRFWLKLRELSDSNELCARILAKAKSSKRVLTEKEVMAAIRGFKKAAAKPSTRKSR